MESEQQTLYFLIISYSLLFGAVCGIIGAVYRFVLAYEWILNWWFRFGGRFESKWFYRPLWGCAKCFAGQLAVWLWFLLEILPAVSSHSRHAAGKMFFLIHSPQTTGVLILGWFCAISAAILTAVFLGDYFEKK